MKLISTKGGRRGGKRRQRYPVSVIILACVTIVLGLTLAVIYIGALTRPNQTDGDAPPSTSGNGTDAVPPGTPSASGADQDTASTTAPDDVEISPVAPDETGGAAELYAEPDTDSSGLSDDDVDDAHEALDPPEMETGERISIDDSGLFSNADDVYYYVYYFASGNYSISGDSAKTPSASVIKVFIMEYAFFLSSQSLLDLGETLNGNTFLHLISIMIQRSDNEATNALINYFGMDTLNAFFLEQGYSDTVLERRMLDFERRLAGFENYTSISDCMSFLNKLYARQDEEPYRQMLEIMKGQQVRTKIPLRLPSGVISANKTGELDNVENDIGIVFTEHDPFAIVILTNGVHNTASMRNAIADFALACTARQTVLT